MKIYRSTKLFIVFLMLISMLLTKFLYRRYRKNKEVSIDLKQVFDKKNIVPVAIIGSGPAGHAAGIYTARLGFNTLIIEGTQPGGQLTQTSYVENWPGQKKILGKNLMQDLKEHNLELGVNFLQDNVIKVDFTKWPFEVYTSDGLKLNALTVIITTGSSPRLLKIPGEKEFWGKGVTTCAICDAPFYKGKNVCVIGGGDSAAEHVLQLASHVKHITMFVRKDKLRASKAMKDRINEIKNLTILYEREPRKIIGENGHVSSIEVFNNVTKYIENVKLNGVFLAIGHIPNSSIFKGQLLLNKDGYIKIKGRSQKTSVPGIFAAGDIQDYVYMQAGVASGDGIKAALDAGSFLNSIGFNNNIAQEIQNNYFEIEKTSQSIVEIIKSQKELNAIVANSKVPIILDFWAEYCPSCKYMLPAFESVAKKFEGKMRFVKIDIDEAKDIVDKLYILKVPTFIVFKDQQIIARNHDVMDKKKLTEFVQQFINT